MIRIASLLALGLFSLQCFASDSVGYAQMARASWSSFECSTLASKMRQPAEQERLFNFGYAQGQEFIAALETGKIKREDLSSHAPVGALLLLEGPSADFILGRIYAAAEENALKDVYRTGEVFNSEATQELIASNKFTRRNCQLIGNGR
jgi:hypothetical protein